MNVLAGDIGGTKTLLAIVRRTPEGWEVPRQQRYTSGSYEDLAEPARAFLREDPEIPDRACFGVAGPVRGRRVEATNLPWNLDADRLERDLGIAAVTLVNDFVATASGCAHLGAGDLEELNAGAPGEGGTRAVLGAGTGLGEAILPFRDGHHDVIPTEGGHASFAPTDDLQIELLRHLLERFDRVSVERLLSGSGLVRIYGFLAERGDLRESGAIRRAMESGDPAAAISRGALEEGDPLCMRALDVFVRIYGAEAGDLALKSLATGGVYVAGGIAPKILDKMKDGAFLEAFTDKGRFRELLERIPVHVVTRKEAPLIGAAVIAIGDR